METPPRGLSRLVWEVGCIPLRTETDGDIFLGQLARKLRLACAHAVVQSGEIHFRGPVLTSNRDPLALLVGTIRVERDLDGRAVVHYRASRRRWLWGSFFQAVFALAAMLIARAPLVAYPMMACLLLMLLGLVLLMPLTGLRRFLTRACEDILTSV